MNIQYTNESLSRIAKKLDGRLDELDSVDSVNRTIYVETTGDDKHGDGKTVDTAFATILAALNDIKAVVNNCKITIQFGTGTFNVTSSVFTEFSEKSLVNDSQIVFKGNGYNEIVSGLTLTPDVDKPYHYTVAGDTFTIDQYNDSFVLGISGAFVFGIITNGTDYLETFIGADSANSIYNHNTIININGDSISLIPRSRGTKVLWDQLLFDFNGNPFKFGEKSDEVITTIKNSIIKCSYSSIGSGYKSSSLKYNHTYMITSTDNIYDAVGLRVDSTFFDATKFMLRQEGQSAFQGLVIGMGTTANIYKLFLYNYHYSIGMENGSTLLVGYFDGGPNKPDIILKDASVAFNLNDNINVTLPDQDRDNHPVNLYIENIDYIVGGLDRAENRPTYYPSKNINFQIEHLYGTPNIDFLVPEITNYVNSGTGMYINIPGIYPEISGQTSSNLIDNTITNLIVGDASQNRSLFVNYSGDRNSTFEQGKLMMLYNDVSITMITENTIGDIGLSFDASINGSNEMLLQCTLTSTGNDASINYDVTRTIIK